MGKTFLEKILGPIFRANLVIQILFAAVLTYLNVKLGVAAFIVPAQMFLKFGIAFRNEVVTRAINHNNKGMSWKAYILKCLTIAKHRVVNFYLGELASDMVRDNKFEGALPLFE